MKLPDRFDASWLATLDNDSLRKVETQLVTVFRRERAAEQKRRGERYDLMRGPESLMSAWGRWSMVRSAMAARGIPMPRLAP